MAEGMRIDGLLIDPPVMLAPMAGYTDTALRSLCLRFHCGLVFTEVANAAGVVHGSHRTIHLLHTLPGERPVGAHLYGENPAVMAEAAAFVARLGRFDLIDINCGCPVRKIVSKGAGVALMADPSKIGRIVRAVREAASLPVTVKTRLGLTSESTNVSEVAQAVEEAGGAGVSIHARHAASKHGGRAAWETLAAVKAERRIPIIGNGGIERARDALDMFQQTGVDGVMIGRAAVGNPWIFAEIAGLLRGDAIVGHPLAEHRAVIAEHLSLLVGLKEKERRLRRPAGLAAEQAAARHFRGHLLKYLRGFRGWSDVRRGLEDIKTTADVMAAVDAVLSRQQAGDGAATG